MKIRNLPSPARIYIALLVLVGAAAVALRVPDIASWTGGDALAFAGLLAAVVLTELVPLRLVHRTEGQNFSLADAPWAAGLVLVRPSVLTLTVAVGIVAAQAIRRTSAVKIAFNAGQFVVSVGAAQLVYVGLVGSGSTAASRLGAAVVAMAAYFVVNVCAVALVIALAERGSFARALTSCLGFTALQLGGNVALGLVAATLWLASPLALPIVALPLVLAHVAYRSMLERIQARARVGAAA